MKFYHIALLGLGLVSSVNAADITIFYSPSCPHCHHARYFITNDLIYEYEDLKVTEINATSPDNRQLFMDTLKKCEYTNGGVPVLVVGDKCFQGYGSSIDDAIRSAIEVDYTDAQKTAANANREQMKNNRDAFVTEHKSRINAIVNNDDSKKKLSDDNNGGNKWLWLVAVIAGLIVVAGLFKNIKKK